MNLIRTDFDLRGCYSFSCSALVVVIRHMGWLSQCAALGGLSALSFIFSGFNPTLFLLFVSNVSGTGIFVPLCWTAGIICYLGFISTAFFFLFLVFAGIRYQYDFFGVYTAALGMRNFLGTDKNIYQHIFGGRVYTTASVFFFMTGLLIVPQFLAC